MILILVLYCDKIKKGVFCWRSLYFLVYLRFSELNSDSRNFRNCSLPTGSFKTSSMPKAHLFTLCWLGSLLKKETQSRDINKYTKLKYLSKQVKILNWMFDKDMSLPGFKLPEGGVIWDPGVRWVRWCEAWVILNILLRVTQQTVANNRTWNTTFSVKNPKYNSWNYHEEEEWPPSLLGIKRAI